MKRSMLHSTFLFAFIFLSMQLVNATNTLTILGGQTNVNDTAFISVNMVNDSSIVAFQIDIPLFDQLTYIDNSALLNSSRMVDHVLDAKMLPGDTLRILGYSLSNTPFSGSTGTIVTFKFLTGTVPGNYPLVMVNPLIGDTSSSNVLTGSINGTETILGPNISLSVNSLNFGEVPLLDSADRLLTVNNIGNQDLIVQSITFDTTYFTIVGNSNFTVPTGQSQNITVRFNSVVKGNYSNMMTITSNDYDESSMDVDLSVIAFAVNELHTGDISVFSGDYTTLDFTINNMEPVVSFQFDLTLPDPLSFVTDSAFLSTRKANHDISANMINSNTLRVVAYSSDNQWFTGDNGVILELGFNVEGVGGYYGIGINNVVIGDSLGLNAVSAYTGGGLQIAAADIDATNSINFGDVSILGSSTENLTVYNYGNDTLEITSIQFSNSSFSSSQTLPLNINPGNSSSIDIGFSNANEGTVSSTMQFFSNDPDENPFTVNLTGYAFVPNYISVYDSMYSYGDTMFVDIVVDNLETFTGFQFDLNYTDSLTCLTNLIQLGPRGGNHVIQVNELDSNTIRLFAYSLSQTEFTGYNGTIVRIPFVGDSAIYGPIPMALDSALLGDSLSQNILWGIVNDSIIIAKPQEIALQTGWNIISLNVTPYSIGMMNIVQPLIDSSNLVKVIDEAGGFIQFIPGFGWMNTIGDMANTEGYYIKVSNDDTIHMEGRPVALPYSIPLQTGWNIMSYPAQLGQDAISALQPLIDSSHLEKVINEAGGFIQFIPGFGWMNTIGNLDPGEGYYIKVNTDATLVLNEPVTKALNQQHFMREGEYYIRNNKGNPYLPMHIVANFEDYIVLAEGDELGVFINEVCIGSGYIVNPLSKQIVFLTTDDPTTEVIDGGQVGDVMSFKLLHLGREYELQYQSQNQENLHFTPLETKFITFSAIGLNDPNNKAENFYASEVVPNPFVKEAKIYLNIPETGSLKIDMLDVRGVVVKQIFKGEVEARNMKVQIDVTTLTRGMYFIHVEYNHDGIIEEEIKKVVVSGK